jgi:hypothetical protein
MLPTKTLYKIAIISALALAALTYYGHKTGCPDIPHHRKCYDFFE